MCFPFGGGRVQLQVAATDAGRQLDTIEGSTRSLSWALHLRTCAWAEGPS